MLRHCDKTYNELEIRPGDPEEGTKQAPHLL